MKPKQKKPRVIWLAEYGHDGLESFDNKIFWTRKDADKYGRPVKFIEAYRKG